MTVSKTSSSSITKWLLLILHQLDRIAGIVARSDAWPILAFFAIYLPFTILIARGKLLWDDEFFTLYLSRPDSIGEILKALQTGADQHPPLFYYLTHQITALLGTSHLTLRLPSIVGFALLCISLFYTLRSRTSVLWAALGMFLPLITGAYYYASEARGYSLMLGCCAVALLAWQNVASPHRCTAWLYVLFGALAMAVSSHYYAVLFMIPLCLGELTRTYMRNRIDIPVWLSFCGSVVPLVVFMASIRHARGYSAHFWAVPFWSSPIHFYPLFLGTLTNVFLVGALFYVLGLYRFTSNEEDYGHDPGFFPWDAVTWASIVAIPLFSIVLAKFVTHAYTERYVLPALIGAVLILCHSGFLLARRPRILPFLLSLICLADFAVEGLVTIRVQPLSVSQFIEQMTFIGPHSASPIVLSDVKLFHRISFYAPRPVVQNFTYVSDPEASVQYIKQDTIDRGMLDLRPWFPLKVVPRQKFFSEHSHFLVFGSIGPWNWMSFELTPPNYQTKLLGRQSSGLLFSAQRITPVAGAPPNGTEESASGDLFRKMSKVGPSLCRQWMPGDDFCTTIEQERQTAARRATLLPASAK